MSQFEANEKRVFAEQLKALVKGWEKANNKKLTQEQIGKAVFVTRETVSGWYNGKTYPPDETRKKICAFFNVPEWYFSKNQYEKGWTEIDKRTHEELEAEREELANKIGLSVPLVAFFKENPAIADAVISASWVDAYMQSLSPTVPLMPDKTFQFVSSSNVKVYPSDEVLYMLRVVQRDLTEYALFLIQKWSKIIEDAHNTAIGKEIHMGSYGQRTETGEEYSSATERFVNELRGRGSITTGASMLVDMYSNMPENEQEKLLSDVHNRYRESRKNNPKAQKIRKAVKKALETNTPVPPIEEIMKENEEK